MRNRIETNVWRICHVCTRYKVKASQDHHQQKKIRMSTVLYSSMHAMEAAMPPAFATNAAYDAFAKSPPKDPEAANIALLAATGPPHHPTHSLLSLGQLGHTVFSFTYDDQGAGGFHFESAHVVHLFRLTRLARLDVFVPSPIPLASFSVSHCRPCLRSQYAAMRVA